MESLPDCSIECKDAERSLNYNEVNEFISDTVGADCWAVVIDGEIIYNYYVDKSYKERLQDDLYRNLIIENPHSSIFMHMNRDKKEHKIELYVFGSNSFKYVITYTVNQFIQIKMYKQTD